MTNNKITLAIETGIQSGSLAILKGGTEQLVCRVGTQPVSRSEELLREISVLLLENDIKKEDIALICVSNAVGSYTGIRIGLATALGIRKAVGCGIQGVSVLEALALLAVEEGTYISAVSANGRDIYAQKFERLSGELILRREETEILVYKDFCRKISVEKPSGLLVNEALAEILYADTEETTPQARIVKTDKIKNGDREFMIKTVENLAYLIGVKGYKLNNASDNIKQVYIREFR